MCTYNCLYAEAIFWRLVSQIGPTPPTAPCGAPMCALFIRLGLLPKDKVGEEHPCANNVDDGHELLQQRLRFRSSLSGGSTCPRELESRWCTCTPLLQCRHERGHWVIWWRRSGR